MFDTRETWRGTPHSPEPLSILRLSLLVQFNQRFIRVERAEDGDLWSLPTAPGGFYKFPPSELLLGYCPKYHGEE